MIYILAGTNTYALHEALQKQVQAFVSEHGDMALERYDGEALEPERVREIIQAMPFLSAKRMVVIKNAHRNKAVAEQLQNLIADVSEATDLMLVEDKPDKRSSYYKTLQKQKNFQQFNELFERDLGQWLVAEAQAREGVLSAADAQYLVSRIGPNQLMLHQELQKLLNYDQQISRTTIDLLTEPTPQSTVFELLDAAFGGNTKKMLHLYKEQRQQKVEPLAILSMLAWQLHILAIIKTAGQKDSHTIAGEAKLSPFVVGKSMSVARKITYAQLKEWVRAAFELDVRLKSESIDPDDALQYLLISFAETK